MKELVPHLKHVFLREQLIPPDLISSSFSSLKKEKFRRMLKKNKGARGRNIFDFKRGNPTNCMHKIKPDE